LFFVYLYSDILAFFHRDIYVINTFVCTYWLKSTQHCRVDMQFELFFSIYFYKWHVCITCCVMGRIWIMRQICVILVCHEYGHVITKNIFFIWKHDYSSWPYRGEWHVTLDSSWGGNKKRLYGKISKRNQFQSNSFFKRLKLINAVMQVFPHVSNNTHV
jgi:hypothetical protein